MPSPFLRELARKQHRSLQAVTEVTSKAMGIPILCRCEAARKAASVTLALSIVRMRVPYPARGSGALGNRHARNGWLRVEDRLRIPDGPVTAEGPRLIFYSGVWG